MNCIVENVIIIGSGCAGLSAAIYTAREGFNPILISGYAAGGQLVLTTVVENYPGFEDGVQGPELIEKMKKQAERFGTRIINDDVTDADFSSRPFRIKVGSKTYEAQTVIIATGASSKMLGLESENKYMGRGVSSCGTCDGPFFKGKDVIVVGGGDTAMEDSIFLTKFATSVTIVHRKDSFRASKIMQEHVFSNKKIKVMWDCVVEEITGDENKVTGARIMNLKTKTPSQLNVQGVFIAIGHVPNTGFLKGKLKLDDQGFIVTKEEVLTDTEGLFVAGDVADRLYKQAVTAAASGVKAALQVRKYLTEQ